MVQETLGSKPKSLFRMAKLQRLKGNAPKELIIF
jgi:hypothetical protein